MRRAALLVTGTLLLTACTPDASNPADPSSRGSSSAAPSSSSSRSPAPGPAADPSPADPSGAPSPAPSSASSAPTRSGAPSWDEAVAHAEELVADLDDEELAGQVILPGYSGTGAQGAAERVEQGFAGVITFGDNVPADETTLREVNEGVQRAQHESGRPWPAVVGVDQEGGPVRRLQQGVTPLPAAMAHGAAADPELSREVASLSGRELRALGFTMVFAPDADVTIGPQDPTIGIRSPGSAPGAVARVVTALAEGYRDAGIVPVVKHFPGHGALTTDSHAGLPASDADLEALRARDLVPFAAAARHDLPVMVGHIALTRFSERPATLSEEVIGLLEDELGADSLVVTDALNMGALAAVEETTGEDRAVTSLRAGADLLLMPPDPEASRAAVVQAVRDGSLPRERLREAAARVVAASLQVGEAPSAGSLPADGSDADGTAARLATASLTSIGSCEEDVLAVGEEIRITGGTAEQRAALGAELARAGIGVSPEASTVLRLVDGGDYAAGEVDDGTMPAEGTPDGGQDQTSAGGADVAVALDLPYGLATVDAPVRIATFGDTAPQMRALAAVLTGRGEPGGRLPVAVGEGPVGAGCS